MLQTDFHLADRPCVAQAIEAAAECNTIEQLDEARRSYDGHDMASEQPCATSHPANCKNPLCIVTEKPEKEDVEAGEPFCGPYGQVMREALQMAGLRLDRIHVCHAVPYVPADEKPLNATKISAGRPFLARELEIVRPKAILMPGKAVYEAMFNRRDNITELLGLTLSYERGDLAIPCRIVYHPAYPLRFRTKTPEYHDQLRGFAQDYASDADYDPSFARKAA